MARTNITLPVGRFVQGSTTTPRDKDFDGKPLVVKTGVNAGKPTISYFIAVAIRKGAERGWWETPWGQQIYQVGAAAFPQQCGLPSFAWKITDGDSPIKNKVGRAPNENENFRGCWVVKCSSTFAPKTFNRDASAPIPADAVKTGFFVQLNLDVDGNNNQGNPGVYLNCGMLALSYFGEEIHQGADPSQVGFGQGISAPAGAMDVPPAGLPVGATPGGAYPGAYPGAMAPPGQPGYPAGPLVPAPPAGSPAPGGAPYVPPPGGIAPAASPSNVPPNPAFLGGPGAVAGYPGQPAPGGAPAYPTPPGGASVAAAPVYSVPAPPPGATMISPSNPQMTPKAQGIPYADYIARGWNDAMLRQHGMMV